MSMDFKTRYYINEQYGNKAWIIFLVRPFIRSAIFTFTALTVAQWMGVL